jgi:hypothetical protein
VPLVKQPDGTIGGSARVPVAHSGIAVSVTIKGEAGTAFTVTIAVREHKTPHAGVIPDGGAVLCRYQVNPDAPAAGAIA